jgi:uncharacterized lipoprotein YmbA
MTNNMGVKVQKNNLTPRSKTGFFNYFVVLLMVVAISACSSSAKAPDTIYYLLDSNPKSFANKQTSDTKLVMIDIVALPDYLKTNQLVMKEGDNRIVKAHYHSWADDLSESIQRALISDLNNSLNNAAVVGYCVDCFTIKVTVEHFYPTADGDAILSGYFMTNSSPETDQVHYFYFSEELVSPGYANSVRQMRVLVSELAQRLQSQI